MGGSFVGAIMGEYRAVPGKVLSCAGFLDRAEAGGHPGKEWLRQERGAQLICTWEYFPGKKKGFLGYMFHWGFYVLDLELLVWGGCHACTIGTCTRELI